MTDHVETRPPHYRWNYAAIVLDIGFFWIASAFVSVSTVLPALARQLTSSEPLIGLTSTIYYGGWFLPQLVVGRLVADKPRKKPYMVAGLIGRVVFWILGLTLWFRPEMRPAGTLALLYVCLAVWILLDALISLPWADIVARAIPLDRRGLMMGLGQFLGGLGGIGAGALVGIILASPNLPFPRDYALLFILAGALFVPGTIALVAVREPPLRARERPHEQQPRGHWLKAIAADRPFRHFIVCRALFGIANMSVPFYVGHAQQVLRLPDSAIGTFVTAQMVAWMVASLGMGLISDRWGPRRVINVGSFAAVAAPLFALILHLTGGPALTWAYPIVFVALGVADSSIWSGFFNYLISSVPEDDRATYVGLGNTISGLITLAPVVGGWLLEASSYTTLFTVTAVIVSAGFLLTFRLRRLAPDQLP